MVFFPMQIRDRIIGLRRVKASDLRPSPANWRTHPTPQRDALRGLLAEIGYCDALIARELEDGALELIDGHLRAETTPEVEVRVLILDLNEAEARKLLTTLDPLAAVAGADAGKLDELLKEFQTDSEAVQAMIERLAREAGCAYAELQEIVGERDGGQSRRRLRCGPARVSAHGRGLAPRHHCG